MAFVPAILLLTIMLKQWSKAATNINEQELSPQSLLQKRISGTSQGQFNIECPQHRQTITQATAWKLYLMLWEVIPIGHWKKRTENKTAWSQVCRAVGMQCSLLAKHELSGAFLPGFKSQGRSQRVGQTEVTARPPWEPLQMHEAQDRVGQLGSGEEVTQHRQVQRQQLFRRWHLPF